MSRRKLKERRRRERARRRWRTLGLVAAGVLVLGLAGFLVWRNNRAAAPLATDEVLALGAQVYAENCAACHGAQGEGHGQVPDAPALDASEHAWHHPDGQIQRLILDGGQQMPGFRDKLSDAEVVAVIRHIQTWWTAQQLQAQQSRSAQDPIQ